MRSTITPEINLKLGSIFGNYIYIEGAENTLFNRLNDGLETIDLVKSSPEIAQENLTQLEQIRKKIDAGRWKDAPEELRSISDSNFQYWTASSQREAVFENEKKRLTKEKKAQPLSTLLIYYQNAKKEKDIIYEEARRVSYNVALENAWGLWKSDKKWAQPGVTTENQ